MERKELLETANELGLEFPKNISTKKLTAMVAEASGLPPPVDETPPPSPAAKPEPKSEEPAAEEDLSQVMTQPERQEPVMSANPIIRRRQRIKAMKDRAMKTSVVTITNRDPRENTHMTTCYLSAENQYFGISKVIPLDIPVELEECLINVAESTMMPLHVDEVKNGKHTGNKVTRSVKKFTISYSRTQ